MAGLIEALRPVIALLLGMLIDLIGRRSQPTAEDGRTDPALRARLRKRVRDSWGKARLLLVAAVLAGGLMMLTAGCAPRTIYVPSGEPVRLRETVRDAKVWVLDENGKPVAGVMDLPEGWYCLPVPETNSRGTDEHE
jgi:hypothetical protein